MTRRIAVFVWMLPLVAMLFSCKEKKVSLKDGEDVEVADFIEFFPEIKLPYTLADTTLIKMKPDSAEIGLAVFTKFIPDSVWKKDFGKVGKPKIYSIGRVAESEKETYLFFRAVQGNKKVGYLACFSADEVFLSMMPLLKTGFESNTSSYAILDKKFQITTWKDRKSATGESNYRKNVFIYNNGSKGFMLIFTEPNQEIIQDVINPIDTFAVKNKLAGDYISNKRNFISFRDGKDASHLSFFIHFEKMNAECIGELKGVARITAPEKAVYREPGNPCAIEFTFAGVSAKNSAPGSVTLKETGGCGTYRDIKCFFEGKYPRQKETQPKKK